MADLPQNSIINPRNSNVKILFSENKIIIREYPFYLFSDEVDKKKRSKIQNKQSENKRIINLHDSVMNIIGIGLCNEWQYFLTGTVDPGRFDRYDADSVKNAFCSMFESIKREYKDTTYCFIIEKHSDGAYHIHGFCNLDNRILMPDYYYISKSGKIVYPSKSQYIQFGINQKYCNIGLTTVSPIYDKMNVIQYCTKYITKDIACSSSSRKVFHSKGLKSFNQLYAIKPDYDYDQGNWNYNIVYDFNKNPIIDLSFMNKAEFSQFNEYTIDL